MCGLAGLIRPGGLSTGEFTAMAGMPARFRHRGPDGEGSVVYPDAVFVQTRLAMVDPAAPAGPLQSPDGRFTLLFNGEIYNHEALRRELEYPFTTRTDTEVAFAALLAWGEQALGRFDGMFALLLWDAQLETAFAAVDPLGVKPLVYSASAERLLIASEAGPLIESGLLPFRPDEFAIGEYLAAPYFSGVDRLPFQGVTALPAGSWLRWRHGRWQTGNYEWRRAARATLLDTLAGAVRGHCRGDARVGQFLSGGVDSSLIAALAPEPLPAYTIAYPHAPARYAQSLIVRSDDVPPSSLIARTLGLPHRVITPNDYGAALDRTLAANDRIAAWEQEVSQNLLAEAAAADGVRAILVGDAADETHAGYSFLLHPDRIACPSLLLEYFGGAPSRIPRQEFSAHYRFLAEDAGYSWKTVEDQRAAITFLIRRLWLGRLLHNGDLHLMAHGVEGRVPFADPRVVSLAEAVPLSESLAGGIEKHHLRCTAAAVLPAEVAWRPKSALTKHLDAGPMIHARFREAWQRYGTLAEPFIDAAGVDVLGPPRDDRETGIRFRLLALLTWLARFSNALPA